MSRKPNIAIIQFPGSNTERETVLAVQRVGMNAIKCLWNEPYDKLEECHGYIIVGGFSYEDRSRAGVIASLDPIMQVIRQESEKGKPVLGICNGAQILVESGLVPGLAEYQVGMALADNKRVKNGHVLGTGYYNAWANLKLVVPETRCAFTGYMKADEWIRVPFAHAEGRFVLPAALLKELQKNNQTILRYCNDNGKVDPEFPVNPNGSVDNLAAVCNPAGNVMAIMPHPERTVNGDTIFASMRKYIEKPSHQKEISLTFSSDEMDILPFRASSKTFEWFVDLVITDNEAVSVQNALNHLELPVQVTRQTHWEIEANSDDIDKLKSTLIESGVLFNSNKERLFSSNKESNTIGLLVRQKEDMIGRQKKETLTNRLGIPGIQKIQRGVVWNLTITNDLSDAVIKRIIDTHILFNPYSHDCYRFQF